MCRDLVRRSGVYLQYTSFHFIRLLSLDCKHFTGPTECSRIRISALTRQPRRNCPTPFRSDQIKSVNVRKPQASFHPCVVLCLSCQGASGLRDTLHKLLDPCCCSLSTAQWPHTVSSIVPIVISRRILVLHLIHSSYGRRNAQPQCPTRKWLFRRPRWSYETSFANMPQRGR